jgi:D-amino-acid dehydrogenase
MRPRPRMGGADEEKLMGYSRLGDRLRVTSSAEFVGLDRGHGRRTSAP